MNAFDLKQFREGKNLTQSEFAENIGVSRSVIAKVENGSLDISKRMGAKLIKAFPELENPNDLSKKNTHLFTHQITHPSLNIEPDYIDYRTQKGFLITGIVGNLEMIEQTKIILQKMAGRFNYTYNESVVCSRFLSMSKRFNLSELTVEFESKNSKELSKAFLESLIEASNECYQAIKDDLQSYSFFLFILNDGKVNND